jgi:glycosyltransferase involved in cell wall biosynthesis
MYSKSSPTIPRLFIQATNVHSGGGAVLLLSLLMNLPNSLEVVVHVDSRMQIPNTIQSNLVVVPFKRSIFQRLLAEWLLYTRVSHSDIVLCFGNLPPLFRLCAHTFVFLQNRYLIEKVDISDFHLKDRCRLHFERFWFTLASTNVNAFIVQTPSMKRGLEVSGLASERPVHIVPFVTDPRGYCRKSPETSFSRKPYDFLYVASGEPHKNHRRLIEAWCLLAQEGYFPSLLLTIDEKKSSDLGHWISQQIMLAGLRVENLGAMPHGKINCLYTQVNALIYPSTFESFGIPLVEARQAGLAVLAAELDFVRDVLDPDETFDPYSSVSIARAVKRFMDWDEAELKLHDSAAFFKALMGRFQKT